MITPFSQLNLGSVEHAWVEYHVAESIEDTNWMKIRMNIETGSRCEDPLFSKADIKRMKISMAEGE
jgi:hypothetical protein